MNNFQVKISRFRTLNSYISILVSEMKDRCERDLNLIIAVITGKNCDL